MRSGFLFVLFLSTLLACRSTNEAAERPLSCVDSLLFRRTYPPAGNTATPDAAFTSNPVLTWNDFPRLLRILKSEGLVRDDSLITARFAVLDANRSVDTSGISFFLVPPWQNGIHQLHRKEEKNGSIILVPTVPGLEHSVYPLSDREFLVVRKVYFMNGDLFTVCRFRMGNDNK